MSPLYDYQCPNGHETEELRKADDRDTPALCRLCDEPLERKASRIAYPGIVDKGRAADAGRTPIHYNRGGAR